MGDPPAETYGQVDFKIKPTLIPSAAITKLATFPHGSGGLGDVWKCYMSTPSGSRLVAVKSIRVHRLNDSELRKAGRMIRREAYVWIQLSHDHILHFEGITDGFGPLPALVSLWMENGTLNDFLKREFSKLTDRRKLELIRQVAVGLSYWKDVAHGDLTPNNILVDDSGNLRLADFGLSMVIPESGNLTFGSLQAGNTRWMAPEFVTYPNDGEEPQSLLKPTKAGDIYSFGCVMLQIFSGEKPYSRIQTTVQVISRIGVGEKPFRGVDINMDEAYRLLLLRCLSTKPEGRPSIIKITTILDPVKVPAVAFSPLPIVFDVFEECAREVQSEESNSTHPHSERLAGLTGRLVKECNYATAQGAIGDVWKCRYLWDGQGNTCEVAVRCVRIDITDDCLKDIISKRLMDDFSRWMQLTHGHILPLFGISYDFGPVPAPVTRWMHNGSLNTFLDKYYYNLTETRKFSLLADIAAGLQYLHLKGVAHANLTGSNVFVDSMGNAVIAYYGLLNTLFKLNVAPCIKRNVRWAAPEHFEVSDTDDTFVSPKLESDIYSFGCIIYQVLSGHQPYHDIRSDHQVVVAILRGIKPKRPAIPPIEDCHWDSIQKCWLEISERPPIADLWGLMNRYKATIC